MTSLEWLDIGETSLTGSIPTEMEDLHDLERLHMDGVSIPKDSVPVSLATKVTQACILCDRIPYQNARAEILSIISDDGDEEVCSDILMVLDDDRQDDRLSIEECNTLKDRCVVCTGLEEPGSEESDRDSFDWLAALNP